MSSLNRVTIIGNLGKDPEIRTTQSGAKIANLSLATSYKDHPPEWHRVVLFAKLADIAEQYMKKGGKVYVEGRIQTREWEKDGEKRYSTEIIGERVLMLDGHRQEQGMYEPSNQPVDDEIPFAWVIGFILASAPLCQEFSWLV